MSCVGEPRCGSGGTSGLWPRECPGLPGRELKDGLLGVDSGIPKRLCSFLRVADGFGVEGLELG